MILSTIVKTILTKKAYLKFLGAMTSAGKIIAELGTGTKFSIQIIMLYTARQYLKKI